MRRKRIWKFWCWITCAPPLRRENYSRRCRSRRKRRIAAICRSQRYSIESHRCTYFIIIDQFNLDIRIFIATVSLECAKHGSVTPDKLLVSGFCQAVNTWICQNETNARVRLGHGPPRPGKRTITTDQHRDLSGRRKHRDNFSPDIPGPSFILFGNLSQDGEFHPTSLICI